MSAHLERVVRYFDETHDDYRFLWGIDRHLGLHCGYFDERHRTHEAAVLEMNRILADRADVRPGDHVLDAGCGVGGSAIWLAQHRGARATGVNVNAMQLGIAAREAARRGLADRVTFRRCDFCETGLPSRSFDVVWALESLCYAEDKTAFLTEAKRLLKPGGRLVVADGFLTRDDLTTAERTLVERWCNGWAIPSVDSAERFRHRLVETGFRNVEFRDVTPHVVPSSTRIYRAAVALYPLGKLMEWIGLRSKLQTRGIASGYYQYQARRRGLGIYGIVTAEA